MHGRMGAYYARRTRQGKQILPMTLLTSVELLYPCIVSTDLNGLWCKLLPPLAASLDIALSSVGLTCWHR
jgi:hypothetical protein